MLSAVSLGSPASAASLVNWSHESRRIVLFVLNETTLRCRNSSETS